MRSSSILLSLELVGSVLCQSVSTMDVVASLSLLLSSVALLTASFPVSPDIVIVFEKL